MLIKRLLIDKHLPIPYGTIFFALSCIIVTTPLLFFPLHEEFAPNPSKNQIFQFIINLFGHGSENSDTFLHFLPNLVGIIVLGIILEHSIGTVRFGVLMVSSWFLVTVYQLFVNIYGLGSSGIFYSWFPFIFSILYYDYKQESGVIKKPFYLIILIVCLYSVFLSPLYWAQFGGLFYFTNSTHYIAIITGVFLLFIWRKTFEQNLHEINNFFRSNQNGKLSIEKNIFFISTNHVKGGFLLLLIINLIITLTILTNYLK